MAGPEVTAALKLRDDMSGPLRDAGNNVGGFSSIVRGATATALGFLGADVIRNVGMFIAGSIEASAAADKLNKQSEAVIKSTGGASGVTSQHISDLANSLKRLSGVQDETIQNGENLLLTFTSIRNEAGKGNDIFDQATKTMLNMSVALGEDTASASIQLGKALNDPIQGVTALRRVGVSFTASQLEQIKALQQSGDLMGAQKIILGELTKEFGGSAEAVGNSASGMLAKASASIDDARKALAGLLLPAIGQVAGAFANVANAAVDWLNANKPLVDQVTGFVGGGLNQLFAVIGSGVSTIQTIAKTFMGWRDAMGGTATVTDNIVALFGVTTSTVGGLSDQLDNLQTAMDDLGNAYESGLGPIFTDLGVLWNTILVPALAQLGAGLASLEPRFSALLTKLTPVVKIIMLLEEQYLKQLINALRVLLPPAINLVVSVFGTLMDAVGVIADLFVNLYTLIDDLFHGRWGKLWGDVEKLFTDAVSGILQVVADLVVGVGQFIGELVDGITGSKGAIPKMWNDVVAWFASLPGAILGAVGNLATLLTAPAVNLIDGFLTTSITSWQAVVGWVTGLPGDIVAGVGDLATLLVNEADGLITGFLSSAVAAWPVVTAWLAGLPGEILTGLGDLGQLLADDAVMLIGGLLEAVITQGPKVLAWFSGLPDRILTALGDLGQLLADDAVGLIGGFLEVVIVQGPKVVAWLAGLPDRILTGIGDLSNLLVDSAFGLVSGFLTSAAAELPAVLAWVQGLPQEILTGIGDLSALLVDTAVGLVSGFLVAGALKFVEVTTWLQGLPQEILNGIGDLSATLSQKGLDLLQGFLTAEIQGWRNIASWLAGAGSRALDAVGDLGRTLWTQGLALIAGFLNAEKSGWTIVTAWLAGVPGSVAGAVGSLASTLAGAGADLVAGFLNGIKNAWWRVTSWVHNELMKLPQVVRDALGIKSPSTVMAAIGENFTSGLQLGIVRSWGTLRRTVAGLQVGLPGGLNPLAAVTSRGALTGGLVAQGAAGAVRDVYVTVEGGVFLDDGPALDRFSTSIANAVRSRPGT